MALAITDRFCSKLYYVRNETPRLLLTSEWRNWKLVMGNRAPFHCFPTWACPLVSRQSKQEKLRFFCFSLSNFFFLTCVVTGVVHSLSLSKTYIISVIWHLSYDLFFIANKLSREAVMLCNKRKQSVAIWTRNCVSTGGLCSVNSKFQTPT